MKGILGVQQLHRPAAWARAANGRRWIGFPSAKTPSRAGRPSPWRCKWRRWNWPACRRTAPACGARPGGCRSRTWTWTCSVGTGDKTGGGKAVWEEKNWESERQSCPDMRPVRHQNALRLITAVCKQQSINLMNTALTRALIQLAENKRQSGERTCGREARKDSSLSLQSL